MSVEKITEQLAQGIVDIAATDPTQALSIVAGFLVGLAEFYVDELGEDYREEIVLEGTSRTVTIGATK